MASPRRLRTAAIVVSISIPILAAAGVAVTRLVLPDLVASRVARDFDRMSSRLPGMLQYEGLEVRGFSEVGLASIRWQAGPDWQVDAAGITVEIDPLAVVFGGPRVLSVGVDKVHVRLGDTRTPFASLSAAFNRARGILADTTRAPDATADAAVGAPRPMPKIDVRSVSASLFMTGDRSISVREGSVTAGPAETALDRTSGELAGRFTLALPGEQPRSLEVSARGAFPRQIEEVSVRLSPSLEFSTKYGVASLGGVAWRPGELVAANPSVRAGERASVKAASVAVRWEEAPPATQGAKVNPQQAAFDTSFLGDEALRSIADRVLAGVRLTEVEVWRPSIDVVIPPGPAPAADAPVETGPESEAAASDNAFRYGIEHACRSAKSTFEGLDGLLRKRLAMAPPLHLLVHGATVNYIVIGEESALAGSSLANIEAEIRRDHASGRIDGHVTFECPETAAGMNEVRFSIDPAAGRIRANLDAKMLPLYPYRSLAPRWLIVERGSALRDTRAAITIEGGKVSMDGNVRLSGAGLVNRRLASSTLRNLDFNVDGRLDAETGAGRWTLGRAALTIKALRVPLDARLTSCLDGPVVALDARIDRMAAQDLVDSVPPEMIPNLEGMRLSGSFSARLELALDTRDLATLKFDIEPDLRDLKIIDMGRSVRLGLLRHSFYHRIRESNGRVTGRVIGPSSKGWVPLDTIPRHVVDALTTSEDSAFFYHKGFSIGGIKRSLQVNLQKGGFSQGGSTLSQQLVKNLFLSREKTLSRKLQEIVITWQMENSLGKEKILELYLNVIEWGPEIYGLREAAMHYFGKNPEELNLAESVFLVTIIPNPRGFHATVQKQGIGPDFRARMDFLLRAMVKRGVISEEQREFARETRLKFAAFETPEAVEKEPPPEEEFSDQ